MTQKQIIDASERVGWTCEITKEKYGWALSFNTDSPCGQDVNAEITVRTLDKVADEMHEYWRSYDLVEEWCEDNEVENNFDLEELL